MKKSFRNLLKLYINIIINDIFLCIYFKILIVASLYLSIKSNEALQLIRCLFIDSDSFFDRQISILFANENLVLQLLVWSNI